MRGIRELSSRSVVGVGRFTSPDAMAKMGRGGVLDAIGFARPSIADPFLPGKIAEGRIDDIRECIGCNICIATGASWRRDGVSRQHVVPFPVDAGMPLFLPDDIMDGQRPAGHVVLYDDDHYDMGWVAFWRRFCARRAAP